MIFLTAKSQVEDDLTKPISPSILFARVATQLTLANARRALRNQNKNRERMVRERTARLSLMQDATIMAMASMAETRDNETGNHIRRTQNYVRTLAQRLQHHRRFAAEPSDEDIELLYKSAPLHDLGKVGIPDRILLKPGRLDSEAFEIMTRL